MKKGLTYKISNDFIESEDKETFKLSCEEKGGSFFHRFFDNGEECEELAWFNNAEINDNVLVLS